MVVGISGKELPILVGQEGMGSEYSGDNSRLKKEIPDIRSFIAGFHPNSALAKEISVEQLYEWYAAHRDEIDKNVLLFDK